MSSSFNNFYQHGSTASYAIAGIATAEMSIRLLQNDKPIRLEDRERLRRERLREKACFKPRMECTMRQVDTIWL